MPRNQLSKGVSEKPRIPSLYFNNASSLTLDGRLSQSSYYDGSSMRSYFDGSSTTNLNDTELEEGLGVKRGRVLRDARWRDSVGKEKPLPPTGLGLSPADFPDGGSEAWLVIVGGWCCLFVSFGWITSIGVFQDYYESNLLSNYSSSTVSWIPSLQACCMFIGAPVFGKIFDSFGPRWLLAAGSFFHVFGLMMASLSTQYYQLLLSQGVCSALGSGAIFYAANNSASTWFLRRRAFAMGILSSGSSLGGVIFP